MGKYTGKKYCPSNGTEGMMFTENFCEQCIHEKFIHTSNENDKKCEIFSNTMIYDVKDKEYPIEWQYDENDKPTCTAFVKWDWGTDEGDGLNEPPPTEPDDPNQLVMPFILEEIEHNVNMRENLKTLNDKRIRVLAEVGRFGTKTSFGYTKDTICLINLKNETNQALCDHLWITVGKQVKDLNLQVGDKIWFNARVTEYYKGYKGYREDVYKPIELDYKLSNPTKFYKIAPEIQSNIEFTN